MEDDEEMEEYACPKKEPGVRNPACGIRLHFGQPFCPSQRCRCIPTIASGIRCYAMQRFHNRKVVVDVK